MAVKYEWKDTRSGRRFVRSIVPDAKHAKAAPVVVEEPETETLPAETVGEFTEDPPKPKRGRPRKVVTDE